MTHFSQDYEQGIKDERERLIAFLMDKNALRESFFQDGLVLYTEYGAIDISQSELEGENND
jgi:hypothetical protein